MKIKMNNEKVTFLLIKDVVKKQGINVLLKKSLSFSTRMIFLILPNNFKLIIASKIKNFKSNSIDEVIDYCFDVLGGLIKPVQIRAEFKEFLKVFQNKSPRTILEIGTDKGGSLFCLCKLAPENATIISLDLLESNYGYQNWKNPIYQMFEGEKQQLLLLRGDSHLSETVKLVKDNLNGEQIDFMFIDGDHSYNGVKKDFYMYSPLVKKGGVIAFHDIASNNLEKTVVGVPTFWNEIKSTYEYKEFINDEKQNGYGIGCLFV